MSGCEGTFMKKIVLVSMVKNEADIIESFVRRKRLTIRRIPPDQIS